MFSVFGTVPELDMRPDRPLRVWFAGEVWPARHSIYDLYFSHRKEPLLGKRSDRLPLWVTSIDWWNVDAPCHISKLVPQPVAGRPRFCNFIYANPVALRAEFSLRLSRYKQVDGLGPVLNTTGACVEDKIAAMRDYRFAIAFENTLAPGYVTEKLLHPLCAGCIPIYWGAEEALRDFNSGKFIYAPNFASADDLIDWIKVVDQDEELQKDFAAQPVWRRGKPAYVHTPQFFADCIEEALASDFRAEVPNEWNHALSLHRPDATYGF
jgi:Glycosyltransferase family 10 (fucosyltransferase) C-term